MRSFRELVTFRYRTPLCSCASSFGLVRRSKSSGVLLCCGGPVRAGFCVKGGCCSSSRLFCRWLKISVVLVSLRLLRRGVQRAVGNAGYSRFNGSLRVVVGEWTK